jgi:outer membrane receptor protein involved in Fe transport
MSGQFRILGLGVLLAAGLTRSGHAADQAASASGQTPDGLEEITVTAQKRSELLTKVPISVTAINQDTLNEQGAKDISDVARLVPGLSLQASNELGDTNISIRGITSDTGAQTTGIYIDDTPVQVRQEVVSSNPYPKIFDLDHVEVLRGPQGTLFGAGSEGGTVRFLTPTPSLQTFSGFVRSELAFTDGGAPSYELGAAVGGPIVEDKVGFRISGWYREDGGYTTRINPVTGAVAATDANAEESRVARMAFKIAPTDNFVVTPALYYQDTHRNDRDFYWESAGPFNELAQIPQPHSDKFVLPSLAIEYDFAAFSVKSITSYFKRDVNDTFDATSFDLSGLIPYDGQTFGGTTLPGYPNYLTRGSFHETQNDWTEELRFTSSDDSDSAWSWVGGLYYGHSIAGSKSQYEEPFDDVGNYLSQYYGYGPGDSLSWFGEAPIDGKYSYVEQLVVRETDKAVFGNVTYAVLDNLKASAGLRVAQSGFDYADSQDGPYGPAAPTVSSGTQKETPVTPRFNLSYQLEPDQLIYATVAKGYRIGGANEPIPAAICANSLASLGIKNAPATYDSDSVWSYELGAKGKFFDNAVLIETSIFWINWSGIQQQVYLPDCGYYYTANLGEAASRGFDIQAQWAVGGGLTLSGNAGLTDARYTKTVLDNGNILARSGDSLATPEWSANLSAEYKFALPAEADGYARLDYQFAGPYYRTGSAETFSYQPNTRDAPATHYVSARIGVREGGWDVSGFIDNLLNSRTSLYRYQDTAYSPGLRDLTFRPLTAGVTAEYKF